MKGDGGLACGPFLEPNSTVISIESGSGQGVTPSIIQRAYELASSGRFKSIEAVERALAKEGYESAHAHLRGAMLRKELNVMLKQRP